MNKDILNFSEWENKNMLNESSAYDKAANWLSRNFGGKVAKIDKLLSDIKKEENDYVDEWEDIISDIDALEIERSQTNTDPAERKKIDRIIIRKNNVLDTLTKKHDNTIKELNKKGAELASKNSRLSSYWELELSNLETDITEDMYKKAKSLSDNTTANTLYKKYELAMEKAKRKDEMFRERYGSLVSFKNNRLFADGEYSPEALTKLPNSDFEARIKSWDTTEVRKIIKYLRKERNESYAIMDREKEMLLKRMESNPDKKSEIKERVKEISSKYMEIIRDLRTKITIANRYV